MHNRVRMVTGSFLVKDLHVWWPTGARHFLQHLIDGDLASNNHGWQWVAGSGAQASPFFRVFNPITQGEKFDPAGDYVRRYVPELRGIPGKSVHRPWELSADVPAGYPGPIVDHAAERAETLRRWESRPRG
jgi:deoxyribodipyrimidine photo-lyase